MTPRIIICSPSGKIFRLIETAEVFIYELVTAAGKLHRQTYEKTAKDLEEIRDGMRYDIEAEEEALRMGVA